MGDTSPALLVMAAGMGSRFGGAKQIEAVSPAGEVILDFSVYDALKAGFSKIILVIKKSIEADVEEHVGRRLRKHCDLQYAFQELDDLPPGFSVSPERTKPWGTGQAVWAARDLCDRPFCVVNADDFYGAEAFAVMADFLKKDVSPLKSAMVGYRLGNTLTPHGSVSRGVCETQQGNLSRIAERKRIIQKDGAAAFTEDGEGWTPLSLDTTVSMQIFGFHPTVMEDAGQQFTAFLENNDDPLKGEYLLPTLVDAMLHKEGFAMKMLRSTAKWFGVTYPEDKEGVVRAIAGLREKGVYPETLWG